ncbi:MAG: lysophospholipid acyltransferase family protein, partial [Planctomycetota bacterium]
LHLRPDDKAAAFGWVLGAAGVGLFSGAVSAGRLSKTVSPILTYPLALAIMAAGVGMTFESKGAVERIPGPQAEFKDGDWVEVSAFEKPLLGRVCSKEGVQPSGEKAPVRFMPEGEVTEFKRADLVQVLGGFSTPLLVMLCLAGLVAGLGGGLLLGRVDADVLAIADEQMRGRVFSLKATAFTFALLGTLGPLALVGDGVKLRLASWMAVGILAGAIPALVMAWRVDMAIWMHRSAFEPPRGLHRAGYVLARDLLWCGLKLLFRYEVAGAENVPKSGPVILAANHASFLDPIFLGCCTGRVVQYTMYSSYYNSFAHPVFRFLRCISVDEKTTLAALKANVRSLSENACVGMFPEGHVSPDGRLQAAKEGVLFLAQRSNAQVIPVALKGNHAILPRGKWMPQLQKLQVIVGQPFTVPKDASREELAELSNKLMSTLAAALELDPPPSK